MLKNITYTNHMNETVRLDTPQIFVQDCELYNYTWNVISKNDKVSGFKRKVNQKSITLVVKGSTEEECNALCNRLLDIMEKDVLTVRYGTLFVGDYYLKCYVVESKKTEYRKEQGFLKITLKMATDFPFWIKEMLTTFGYGEKSIGSNLDYNRDFPSDYTSNLLGKQLNNTGFVASNFRMVIFGACATPGITIAGHLYEVAASIAVNEYLTIDSVKKTVVLTHTDGTTENCFKLRNRDSYIFEKVPVGLLNVAVNGDFKFEIVLLEERSEPKWT